MKTKIFLILFLLFAGKASAQTVVSFAPEIIGSENFGSIGFVRTHWITSTSRMIDFLQPAYTTSIRAYNPVADSWAFLFPSGSGSGIEGRDNFGSFYIPALDELWVWDGSHIETFDGAGGARWGGRFSLASNTWVARSDPALSSDPDKNNKGGPFDAVIDLTATGGKMLISGIDPAMAWAATSNMGLMLGGSGDSDSSPVFLFEPKAGGPEPYKLTLLTGARPPARTQCMNCMVSDGTNFFLTGGFYQLPGDNTHYMRQDLWKFTVATRQWTQLKPPPDMGEAPAVTYDSAINAVVLNTKGKIYVYDIATDNWTDRTPPGFPCIFNQTAVYIPAPTNAHFYEGGNDCATSNSPFQNLKVTLNTSGFSIPNRTWVARPFHVPNAPAHNLDGTGGGAKHMRWAQRPSTGIIYELGGDWSATPVTSEQTMWQVDLVNDTWVQELSPGPPVTHGFPGCGNQGEFYPGGPDEVGWVWDSLRNKFWVLPGYYFISQGESHSCSTASVPWNVDKPGVFTGHWHVNVVRDVTGIHYYEGTHWSQKEGPSGTVTITNISIPAGTNTLINLAKNGMGARKLKVMTYDPATKLWTVVENTGEENGPRWAIYDAAADKIRRVTPGNDLTFTEYDPATNTRTAVFKTCAEALPGRADSGGPCAGGGVYVGSLQPGQDYQAWDPVDRRIYLIDPTTFRAFYYNVDNHRLVEIAPPPEVNPGRIALARSQCNQCSLGDFIMPVWDTANHVMLYPYVDFLDYCEPVVRPCVEDPNSTNKKYGSKPVLLIYHPDTDTNPSMRDTWEIDPMFQPEGRTVRADSFFYDQVHNVMLAIGGLSEGGDADGAITHYFLYRYGTGTGGTGGGPTTATLTVNNPVGSSALPVTITPVDNLGQGSGSTPITRFYTIASTVTVTVQAPATFGGNAFAGWSGPCDQRTTTVVANDTCHVIMTSNKSITPAYATSPPANRRLTITSVPAGIPMTVTPNDIDGQGNCLGTQCERVYTNGTQVTVTAPATFAPDLFYTLWTGNCTSVAGRVCTVDMTADKTINAPYVACSATTWRLSAQFSNVQGQCGWTYRDSAGDLMTFVTGRWQGPEVAELIFPGGVFHPGTTRASIARWTSPIAGTVRIQGNVADGDPAGGDGVDVTIVQNGTATLFSTTLANGNVSGVPYDITVLVAIGDTLDFSVAPRANSNNDTTIFDPMISPANSSVFVGGVGIRIGVGAQLGK